MRRFERELRGRILGVASHVTISGADGWLTDWRALDASLRTVPDVKATFLNVGDNPTMITTRPAYTNPCVALQGSLLCHPTLTASCWYGGTEQDVLIAVGPDAGLDTASDMYICARGAGFVKVIDQTTGALNFYNDIAIPGIRYVASTVRQ